MSKRTVLLVTALVLAGCGGSAEPATDPNALPFTRVDLPDSATPVLLAAAGDDLLIGVRRDGQPVVPGLLRRSPDGAIADVSVRDASPYGTIAVWHSIAVAGERIVALGGKTGGAHGNVRWTAWAGTPTGVVEKPQSFNTFGGYGAGDMIDAVLADTGPALVGTRQSKQAGADIAIWTPDGDVWTRQDPAGTVLESTRESLKYPMSATATGPSILVAGWELAGGRQRPVVWHSTSGNTGWASSALPDTDPPGTANAVRCWDSGCGIAGRAGGKLAAWQLTGDRWVRLAGVPDVAVGDADRLVAPVEVGGRLTLVVADRGKLLVASAPAGSEGDRGGGWGTVRPVSGPAGTVTAAVVAGNALYVVADGSVWRADLPSK